MSAFLGRVPCNFFISILVGTGQLSSVAAQDRQGVVEAVGEAQIVNADQVAAKKTAIADGLRRCIEKVVGIFIQSNFASTMKEVVKNNKNEFTADVENEIIQKAEGFIDKYEVLSVNVVGQVLKVRVKAKVFETKVQAELQKIADLIAAAGNPRVMIMVQDVHVGTDGRRRVKPSILGDIIASKLVALGIEVKDSRSAKRAMRRERDFKKAMDNTGGFVDIAARAGADILIFGNVEFIDKGVITNSSWASQNGQRSVEISSQVQGVLVSTGELFSGSAVQRKTWGTTYERAVFRELKGRGRNIVVKNFDSLFADLKTSFRKMAAEGRGFEVRLDKVKSFRRQGQAFLGALGGLSGVAGVRQKSFAAGSLVIELRCTCSATELQERIFKVTDALAGFDGLDISNVSGDRLTFRL